MEWLLPLAALACPIGMLAMGAVAWVVGKRGRTPDAGRADSSGASRETVLGSDA